MATPDDASQSAASGKVRSVNSLQPSRPRPKGSGKGVESARPPEGPARRAPTRRAAPAALPVPAARPVPQVVRERFVQVRNHYYFPDGARAFTDRGNRLTTPSENTEVIRSLVAIAKAREWNEITVRGTERFRKAAWFAARLAGLEVRGYRPSEVEQAHLVRRLGRQNGVAAGEPPDREPSEPKRLTDEGASPRRDRPGLLTGRLIDHGRANYRHERGSPMSYFVKLETSRGDRTVWGVDLERALKESLTQPAMGDEVGLRTVRQDAVKVKTPERDGDGNVVGERDLDTHRNRWIIEKRGFFEARAHAARLLRNVTVDPRQAVKEHPELAGTYLQLRAAELAAKRLPDPGDRERFVETVRAALADSVARGEPMPPVRLRERRAERPPERGVKARERETAGLRG
ncbi:MAG TPA: LPD7 domain-containing protein, partial [Candidatus Angelobacter sp.]|nr:LPD7 domain-containing protein [Candidatus Angelobacter sp.]